MRTAPATAKPATPSGASAGAALSVWLACAALLLAVEPELDESSELEPELPESVAVAVAPLAVLLAVAVPEFLVRIEPGTMVVVSCERAVGAVASTVMPSASVEEAEA